MKKKVTEEEMNLYLKQLCNLLIEAEKCKENSNKKEHEVGTAKDRKTNI